MITINVPELYCPAKSQLCPHVITADEMTTQWVKRFNLIEDKKTLHRYLEEKFTWMTGRFYPYASLERLVALSEFYTLLFTVDDHLAGKSKSYMQQFVGRFMQVVTENLVLQPGEDIPVFVALSDFWTRITPLSRDTWRQQFVDSLVQMYKAAFWEQQNISQGNKISLKEYLHIRQFLAAAHIATDAIELADASHFIPAAYAGNKDIADIVVNCRNSICWANDLFSLPKEIEQGEYHNLVLIIQAEYGISLEEAITESVRIHDEEVKQFMYRWKKINIATHNDRTMNNYILSLLSLMRGNIDWSIYETGRYYNFSYGATGILKKAI